MSKYTERVMERRSHLTREGKPACSCCQTAVSVFAEDAGYDEETAVKAATYFRGGMQMGAVCGAVTGSLMAMGLAGVDDPGAVNDFCRKIRENHDGMINCADLLRVNAEKGGDKLTHCNALICECVSCTEAVLRDHGVIE